MGGEGRGCVLVRPRAPAPVLEQRGGIFLDENQDVTLNVIGLGGQERQQCLQDGASATSRVRASSGARFPRREVTWYIFKNGRQAVGGEVGDAA